jgi:hypothetical protein
MEVHDPDVLAAARAVLEGCDSPRQMALEVVEAVNRNERWRGRQCEPAGSRRPTTLWCALPSEIGTPPRAISAP